MSPRAAESAAAAEALELLGLDAQRNQSELGVAAVQQPLSGPAPRERGAVDISESSLLGSLFYLSQAVAVPESHRQRGYVATTVDEHEQPFDCLQVTGDLRKVHCHATPLGQLFALQAGGAKSVPPVLTLSVGG